MTRTAHGWRRLAATTVFAFGLAACSQDGSTPLQPTDDGSLGLSAKGGGNGGSSSEARTLDPAAVI